MLFFLLVLWFVFKVFILVVVTLGFFLQVLSSDNFKYGYNAATGKYEDLMAAGIIDPTKVACSFCLYCQNKKTDI